MDHSNPLKDLMESIPWQNSSAEPLFHMLNWVILDGFHLSRNNIHSDSISGSVRQKVGVDVSQAETESKVAKEDAIEKNDFYPEFYMKRVARVSTHSKCIEYIDLLYKYDEFLYVCNVPIQYIMHITIPIQHALSILRDAIGYRVVPF